MIMSFKRKFDIAPGFEKMFEHTSAKDSIEHGAKIIQMKILSAMENAFSHPITKKELAIKLNTSASYITQLYRGDKLMNLEMLARIQEAFEIEFDVAVTSIRKVNVKPTIDSFKKNRVKKNGMLVK